MGAASHPALTITVGRKPCQPRNRPGPPRGRPPHQEHRALVRRSRDVRRRRRLPHAAAAGTGAIPGLRLRRLRPGTHHRHSAAHGHCFPAVLRLRAEPRRRSRRGSTKPGTDSASRSSATGPSASPLPGSSPTRSASTARESGSACSPVWRPQPYFCSAAARAPSPPTPDITGAWRGLSPSGWSGTSAAARPFTAWPRAAVRAIDARVAVRQGAACYARPHLSESSRADEAERPCHKTCARTSLGHVQLKPGGKS
ncbi:hypothetical protein GA0115254_128638 [Streptomyces sp. Ncost-T10-10d]|nr:hypothetical protein GA0115254_128638 [Streptomyces sp. Ncost-T10-10d]